MIRLLNISHFCLQDQDELLEKFVEHYPEGVRGRAFQSRLPDNDPRTIGIIDAFESLGFQPHKKFRGRGAPDSMGYTVRPNYEYEPIDLENADYYEFVASKYVDHAYVSSEEGLHLKPGRLRANVRIAEADSYSGTIVSDATRLKMEKAAFVGLVFLPTVLAKQQDTNKPKPLSWDKVAAGPYWQIRSEVVLPRLHPRCRPLNRKGEPCNGDYQRGCFLVEGDFPAGELNYLRSDLEQVEPFDIAITDESFGNGPSFCSHKLVVSKRFRDFVIQLDPRSYWTPVYTHSE